MDTWDLTKIYKTSEDFEKELDDVSKNIVSAYPALEGTLSTEEGFKKFLTLARQAMRPR